MPTKKENRETVIELVKELGLEMAIPKKDDLNSTDWADLVSDLKAKKRDSAKDTVADGPKEETPKETPEVAESKYVIKAGCSVTSLKGVLAPGAEVKPEFFTNGKEAFAIHEKNGLIVKAK